MAVFLNGLFCPSSFRKNPEKSSGKHPARLYVALLDRPLPRGRSVIDSGFTLLEIIVAVFVFSILITAVFNSFRSISSSAEALKREDAYYQAAHAALSQILRDFESIYVTHPPGYQPPGFNAPPDPYRVFGEPSSKAGEQFPKLQFTSFGHIAINGDESKGIAQIVYYCHRIGTDQFVLRRSDHIWPFESVEENGNNPILCEKVRSLQFNYYDSAGETRDHWDSDSSDVDNATPRAIEIKLEIGDDRGSVSLGTIIALPVHRDKIAD